MLWREKFSKAEQKTLLDDVLARIEQAPFYRPVMPGSGKAFSVEESNFGPLGWVSDKSGYRYQATHPVTGKAWPAIPASADRTCGARSPTRRTRNAAWSISIAATPAWACIRTRTRKRIVAPVVSVSLGDEALFRIGGDDAAGTDPKRAACPPAMW